MENRAEAWKNEINLFSVHDEQFQQAFANVLNYEELDLQSRSYPDFVFDGLPTWCSSAPLTNSTDNQIEFSLTRPDPVLITSIRFNIKANAVFTKLKAADIKKIWTVNDFFAQMFDCVQINMGNNSCNIDHLDNFSNIFHYVTRLMFAPDNYENYFGAVEGWAFETLNKYQFENNEIPANSGVSVRNSIILSKLLDVQLENSSCCIMGDYVPGNLFFQKHKIIPPYVPLRFILKRTPASYNFKIETKSILAGASVDLKIQNIFMEYMAVKIRPEIYSMFREQYQRNLTRIPALEMPLNPFENPSAIYQYLDVRAQKFPITSGNTSFYNTIRMNSNRPKAIVLALAKYLPANKEKNHFEFEMNLIKDWSIIVNCQNIFKCSVTNDNNCSLGFKETYLRFLNFINAGLTFHTGGVTYQEFVGGGGLLCELSNETNSLFVPQKPEISEVQIKINFTTALTANHHLYVFTYYDQNLIIDDKFNVSLMTSV